MTKKTAAPVEPEIPSTDPAEDFAETPTEDLGASSMEKLDEGGNPVRIAFVRLHADGRNIFSVEQNGQTSQVTTSNTMIDFLASL